MRIYVLVTSCDPLKVFLFKDGLVRLATIPYTEPRQKNIKNTCMHLTNYAINKNNKNFEFNVNEEEDFKGSKRSVKRFYEFLAEKGLNSK